MNVEIVVWVIGWMFACGVHYEACRARMPEQKWFLIGYVVLLPLWPHYLGSWAWERS